MQPIVIDVILTFFTAFYEGEELVQDKYVLLQDVDSLRLQRVLSSIPSPSPPHLRSLTQTTARIHRDQIFQRYYENYMLALDILGVIPVGFMDLVLTSGSIQTLLIVRALKLCRLFRLNRLVLGNTFVMEGTVGSFLRWLCYCDGICGRR